MFGSGAVRKRTQGDTVVYDIGDVQITASALVPELEGLLGRVVVLRVEEGIPLKRTRSKNHAPYDRNR